MGQPGSARMVTPEAVALEFQTANVGSRILAYVIDMAIVLAGILAGVFAVALLGQATDVVVPDWVAVALVLVLLPAWWLGYFIAFETLWRGRTPGKAALGLRVVTTEGAPVRFRHAAIRALLGLVDVALASGFFAVIFILLTRDNQRLGDLVAGTLVLRERSGLAAPAPVSFAPPPGLEAYTATLDTSRLTMEEYQAVRTFLLRAASLPPGPRAALALQLANPLAARLRPPPPAGISPEQFLACVGAAHQRRQRQAAWGPAPPHPALAATPPAPLAGWPGRPGPPPAEPAPARPGPPGPPAGWPGRPPAQPGPPEPAAPPVPTPPAGGGFAPPG